MVAGPLPLDKPPPPFVFKPPEAFPVTRFRKLYAILALRFNVLITLVVGLDPATLGSFFTKSIIPATKLAGDEDEDSGTPLTPELEAPVLLAEPVAVAIPIPALPRLSRSFSRSKAR